MNENDRWWIKYTSEADRVRGWGTVFDYLDDKKIPPQYTGSSFFESDHDAIETFNRMSNEEKWLKAYWAEQQAHRRGTRSGLWLGFFIGLICFALLSSLFN
ncbi:MAG: hypothetical protein WD000_01615 [Thermodesulfobacteriota bacterium]